MFYTHRVDAGRVWSFWTPQERSYVLQQAYRLHKLSESQISSYLSTSRLTSFSNWSYFFTFPLLTRIKNLAAVSIWIAGGLAWLNLNPMWHKRQNHKEKMLQLLYDRFGLEMKDLNDKLPRWSYVDDIDRQTRRMIRRRNGWLAGIIWPGIDYVPVLSQGDLRNPKKIIK